MRLPRQKDQDIIIHSEGFDPEDLKIMIRELNLKVTPQRLLILKTLHTGRRHVTAQELFDKVVKVDPEIGFATVYRLLKTLTEGQVVTEVKVGGLPAKYELNRKEHHDHLSCVSCGKICEFENKAIEELQVKVANQFGFQLKHHILQLYGVCPDCQEKAAVKES